MSPAFKQFCEIMVEAINTEAMKHADSLTTWESVSKLPEAIQAFELTLKMAEINAK